MALKKREPMQFAPPTPVNGGALISEPPTDPEPMVKLGVMIYKSLFPKSKREPNLALMLENPLWLPTVCTGRRLSN